MSFRYGLKIENGFHPENNGAKIRVYHQIDVNTLKYLDVVCFREVKDIFVDSDEDRLIILLLPQFTDPEKPFHYRDDWRPHFDEKFDVTQVQNNCECQKRRLNDLDCEVEIIRVASPSPVQTDTGPTTNVVLGDPQ